MVTVIMTIHMETNTKRAIIENERNARVKRLKTLAHVYVNTGGRSKMKVVKEEGKERGEARGGL